MSKKLKPIRHGEIMLVPVDTIPTGARVETHKEFIVGHSETGHHHVLEGKNLKYGKTSDFEVIEAGNEELYFRLFEPGTLVHKKATDRHKDLEVPAGLYQRFHDTEYDPFQQIIRDVAD